MIRMTDRMRRDFTFIRDAKCVYRFWYDEARARLDRVRSPRSAAIIIRECRHGAEFYARELLLYRLMSLTEWREWTLREPRWYGHRFGEGPNRIGNYR